MAHVDAREGKWRGNWRMEWVASTLTTPPNVVYPALLKLMRTPRLPAVDWTDTHIDLNGLVRFGERRNLVSARVPSRSARAITENDRRQQALLDSQDLLRTYMNFRNCWNTLSSRLQSVRTPSLFHGPRIGNHWLIVFVCWNGFKLVLSERNLNLVYI